MKLANSARVIVFCKEDENNEEITKGLADLFPFALEDNRLKINKTNAEGFSDKKIEILEVTIRKENLIRQFLGKILQELGKRQIEVLKEQKESRLDSNLDFFMRFEKDYWISQRKLALTDSGKCYHLRISIAAFPKKRENAIKIVDKLLGGKNV